MTFLVTGPKTADLASCSDSFNGAVCDKYRWSQTEADIDISIPVASDIIKGSQVKVDVMKSSFKVRIRGEVFLEGDFQHHVKDQETVWNLEPGL